MRSVLTDHYSDKRHPFGVVECTVLADDNNLTRHSPPPSPPPRQLLGHYILKCKKERLYLIYFTQPTYMPVLLHNTGNIPNADQTTARMLTYSALLYHFIITSGICAYCTYLSTTCFWNSAMCTGTRDTF